MVISALADACGALPSSDQVRKETTRRFRAALVVGLVAAEDEVAFGAGDGDVEDAFFLLQVSALLGLVAGELVLGHAGDEHGVELQAFGLVDGEDGDAGSSEA